VDTLVCFGARLDEVCVRVFLWCACMCVFVVLCYVCVCSYNYNDYCNHSIFFISLDTTELNVRMF
jgi:hypothetical protein